MASADHRPAIWNMKAPTDSTAAEIATACQRAADAVPHLATTSAAQRAALLNALAEALAAQRERLVPLADAETHLGPARLNGELDRTSFQLRGFAELMTYLGTMIIPRTRLNTAASAPEGRLPYLERVHLEHENILEAIRRQEPEAARAAMRTHLSNSRERLRRAQPEA